MAVGNADGNPGFLGALEGDTAQAILMNMDDPVFRMCPEECGEGFAVRRAPWNQAGYAVEPTAQR